MSDVSTVARRPVRFKIGTDRNRPKMPAPVTPEKVTFKPAAKQTLNGNYIGEELFLQFACCCLDYRQNSIMRRRRDAISKEDAGTLMDYICRRKKADHFLIDHCFHKQVQLLAERMGKDPLLDDPWPIEKVRELWHMHKGHTPVMSGVIMSVNNPSGMIGCVTIMLENKSILLALNPYALPAQLGKFAHSHNEMVAEVE